MISAIRRAARAIKAKLSGKQDAAQVPAVSSKPLASLYDDPVALYQAWRFERLRAWQIKTAPSKSQRFTLRTGRVRAWKRRRQVPLEVSE